jgi:hypothetical protein
MKNTGLLFIALFMLSTPFFAQENTIKPVSPNASPEAKALT